MRPFYRFLRYSAVAVATICITGFAPDKRPLELSTVLQNTVLAPPARVRFREQRYNPLFKEPLVLTGYLEYIKPGSLMKVIESPFQETYLIEDRQISVIRDGVQQKLALSSSRSFRAMLSGIESLLAGDERQLRRVFTHQLHGEKSGWTIELAPRSRRVARHLLLLKVSGGEHSIDALSFNLKGDESHEMMLLHTAPDP